jgi:hypothetical protein
MVMLHFAVFVSPSSAFYPTIAASVFKNQCCRNPGYIGIAPILNLRNLLPMCRPVVSPGCHGRLLRK